MRYLFVLLTFSTRYSLPGTLYPVQYRMVQKKGVAICTRNLAYSTVRTVSVACPYSILNSKKCIYQFSRADGLPRIAPKMRMAPCIHSLGMTCLDQPFRPAIQRAAEKPMAALPVHDAAPLLLVHPTTGTTTLGRHQPRRSKSTTNTTQSPDLPFVAALSERQPLPMQIYVGSKQQLGIPLLPVRGDPIVVLNVLPRRPIHVDRNRWVHPLRLHDAGRINGGLVHVQYFRHASVSSSIPPHLRVGGMDPRPHRRVFIGPHGQRREARNQPQALTPTATVVSININIAGSCYHRKCTRWPFWDRGRCGTSYA